MGKRLRQTQILAALGAFLLLAACALWQESIPATLPVLPTQPGASPQPWTPRPPVHPPTASSLPPTTSSPLCEPVPQKSPEAASWTFSALRQGEVLGLLNAGMSPESLNAQLQQQGLGGYPKAVYTGEINGDGYPDALLALVNPTSGTRPPAGTLLVALGSPQGYCLAQSLETEDPALPGLVVHGVEDLNADGRLEAVVGWTGCGEVTCTERLQVLAWRDHALTNRLSDGLEAVDPWVEILPIPEGTGYRVAVHTEGAPGGTGPARSYTLFYDYDEATDTWVHAGTQWAPPQTRIHLLHDADRAAQQGDELQALLLYGQVIASQEVRDEALPDAGEPARLHAILAAYARFRMLVLHAHAGHQAIAQATYAELHQAVDSDPALLPYFEMATAFWEAYQKSGWEAACQAAREYAQTHADAVLTPLGPQVYGTNNRAYTPENICATGAGSP